MLFLVTLFHAVARAYLANVTSFVAPLTLLSDFFHEQLLTFFSHNMLLESFKSSVANASEGAR